MTLKKPKMKTNACQDILSEVKVLLEPNSLFIMSKESRFEYRHGITKAKLVHLRNGDVLRRDDSYRRISLTIRELKHTRRRTNRTDTEWIDT